MATASMNFDGLAQLLAQVNQLQNADEIIEQTLKEVAPILKTEMESRIVRSTLNGLHIKDDIQVSKLKGTGDNKYIEVGPSKNTEWKGKFVEFGTVHNTAKPFVGPALVAKKGELIQKMGEVLARRLIP